MVHERRRRPFMNGQNDHASPHMLFESRIIVDLDFSRENQTKPKLSFFLWRRCADGNPMIESSIGRRDDGTRARGERDHTGRGLYSSFTTHTHTLCCACFIIVIVNRRAWISFHQ